MQTYHNFVAAYLGKQMQKDRLEWDYTQEEMAQQLVVSRRMYAKYEKGESICSADILLCYEMMLSDAKLLEFIKEYREVLDRWWEAQKQQQQEQEHLQEETARAKRKRWRCKR